MFISSIDSISGVHIQSKIHLINTKCIGVRDRGSLHRKPPTDVSVKSRTDERKLLLTQCLDKVLILLRV